MIEVMIERWSNRDGTEDFVWSVWQDGERLQLGRAHRSGDAAEQEAVAFCRAQLNVVPDEVVRL